MSAFDHSAPRYDDDERANSAFQHQRQRSLRALREAFAPRDALLEVGCGTGTEASSLAARGASLALVDASAAMLDRAREKVSSVREGALLGAHHLPASRLGELVSVYGRARFDGAFSSLGPLNCEGSLAPVARALAALVRPGGSVVLSVMSPWCLVETLWFATHGRFSEATRRWRSPVRASAVPGGPAEVSTWYWDLRAVRRAFSEGFVVEHAEALPLLFPPTWLAGLVEKLPRAFAVASSVEPTVARWPVLRALGDHTLVRLRRTSLRP